MSLSSELREAVGDKYDAKKAQKVAEGIAKLVSETGRDVTVNKGVRSMRTYDDAYTVGWYEKSSYRTTWMSFQVFVTLDGMVTVGARSDNHELGGARFPFSKMRSEIRKLVKVRDLKPLEPAAPAQAASTLQRVPGFLRGLRLGPGGTARNVGEIRGGKGWEIEPTNRQRLDHYVGSGYDPGPDDDPEGWDEEGWDEDYAEPVYAAVMGSLDREFGKGMFSVDVGDKGFVNVYLTSAGQKKLG